MVKTTQLSMLPEEVLSKVVGDNREKIMGLYRGDPNLANNDRALMLAFWKEYDGLKEVLGDRFVDFADWWIKQATNPESIRRSRQNLTENTKIWQKRSVKKSRDDMAGAYRGYWKGRKL